MCIERNSESVTCHSHFADVSYKTLVPFRVLEHANFYRMISCDVLIVQAHHDVHQFCVTEACHQQLNMAENAEWNEVVMRMHQLMLCVHVHEH